MRKIGTKTMQIASVDTNAGVAIWQLPLLWGFFNGVKAATGVPGGALADRAGKVPAIVLGWIVYALSYAGFAFVSGPLAIWGLFALYALFFGLTEGSERAFVADLVPVDLRGRAYGAFYAAVGIALCLPRSRSGSSGSASVRGSRFSRARPSRSPRQLLSGEFRRTSVPGDRRGKSLRRAR